MGKTYKDGREKSDLRRKGPKSHREIPDFGDYLDYDEDGYPYDDEEEAEYYYGKSLQTKGKPTSN